MNHLFLFTIGPVQSFIEQARKTRDLRNGSLIIAWMIAKGYRFAINTFQQSHNAIPIFPALPEQDESNYYGLPNRFLIGFDTENPINIHEIGEHIQSHILDEFHSLAMSSLTYEMKKWNGKAMNIPLQEYKYQLESQWEMYWAGLRIEDGNYVNAYRKIERLLGSIKNTRPFAQLQNEKSRKCSLSGERDALFLGARKDDQGRIRTPAYTYSKASTIITGLDNPQLSVNEGLSAIGFVKRYVSIDDQMGFPSTAGIALMSWKKIAQQYANEAYQDFNKKILQNKEDDQLFYEENLTDSYLEKNGLNYLRKYTFEERILPLKTIKSAIHQHKKDVKKTSYYALLSFDGDRMGKWMNGDNLLDENQLLDFHRKFAKCLKEFAKSASEKLESNEYGKPVYAGGDDFIGFITLQHVFDALKTLRVLFDKSVNQHPELIPYKKEYESFSFSGGLVIAHYKTPLGEVIRTAKQMEKLAKNIHAGDRNALAIKILKHAGETEVGYIKWGDEVEITKNIDLIKYLVKGMQKKDISRKFIQVLGREFMELLGIHDTIGLFPEAKRSEITRIVKRSCNTNVSPQAKTNYAEKVNILHDTCSSLTNFLSILKIIDFLNRETYAD